MDEGAGVREPGAGEGRVPGARAAGLLGAWVGAALLSAPAWIGLGAGTALLGCWLATTLAWIPALLGATLAAAALGGWGELRALRRSLAGGEAGARRARTLATSWLGLAAAGGGLLAARWLLANSHDHELAAAALLLGILAALAGVWVLGGWLERALRPLGRRLGPWATLGAATLPWPLALGALLLSPWVGFRRLPLAAVASWGIPVLAALAARGWAEWRARRGRAVAPWRLAGALALAGAVGAAGLWAPVTERGELLRRLQEGQSAPALSLAALRRASDWDGDGYSGLLGGGDCAPWDPSRNPGAVDRPGNGIDENCMGGDRVLAEAGHAQFLTEGLPLAPDGAPWSFLLLVMDAVRADHVSFLGYERPTTPHLAALAQRSFVFPRAYSPAATTRFSVPALLNGRPPSAVAWTRRGRNLFPRGEANRMLQERLAAAGYFTAAVLCNYDIFEPSFGLKTGFTAYDIESVKYSTRRTIAGRTATAATDAGLRLLEQAGPRPFFLYIHYMDAHAPYDDPDGPTFGERDIDRYDAEILHVDQQIARLLAGLTASPAAAHTIVLVTADHGDQFQERGHSGHGRYVYDEEVHVPLLVTVPGVTGRRVPDAVSLVDLAPTLANLAGSRDEFERFEGRSLAGILGGAPRLSDPRPAVVETWPFAAFGQRRVALVDPPHKLIFNFPGRSWELYDLERDPGERDNRVGKLAGPTEARLREVLGAWLEAHPLR